MGRDACEPRKTSYVAITNYTLIIHLLSLTSMNATLENTATKTSNGIKIERVFNAPRQLVWDAWTKPEHIEKWWGPRTYSAPFVTIDARVGGHYLYCMRSSSGEDTWVTGKYLVLDPISRIEFTDSFADEKGNIVSGERYGMPEMPREMIVRVTFEDLGNKTKMTMTHEGLPAGEMSTGALGGWSEMFDKLEEALAQ
jgi:uncharacterized protein YndB with AHSA1/START domain